MSTNAHYAHVTHYFGGLGCDKNHAVRWGWGISTTDQVRVFTVADNVAIVTQLHETVAKVFKDKGLDTWQLEMMAILVGVTKTGNEEEVDWVLHAVGDRIPCRADWLAKILRDLEDIDFYPGDEGLAETLKALREIK